MLFALSSDKQRNLPKVGERSVTFFVFYQKQYNGKIGWSVLKLFSMTDCQRKHKTKAGSAQLVYLLDIHKNKDQYS